MNKWDYGGYSKKHNMENEITLKNGILKVHDIFDKLPKFMQTADLLFVDPPWNLTNVNSFYTKADKKGKYTFDFERFYIQLFTRISEIKPIFLFVEIGKEYLGEFIIECKKQYKYVTFYNSTYYGNKKNKCYVVQATNIYKKRRFKELEDIDEEKIIEWICKNINYNCIGDLCTGKGLVPYYSNLNNKKFVGTELNKKRLAVAVERIIQNDRKIGGK